MNEICHLFALSLSDFNRAYQEFSKSNIYDSYRDLHIRRSQLEGSIRASKDPYFSDWVALIDACTYHNVFNFKRDYCPHLTTNYHVYRRYKDVRRSPFCNRFYKTTPFNDMVMLWLLMSFIADAASKGSSEYVCMNALSLFCALRLSELSSLKSSSKKDIDHTLSKMHNLLFPRKAGHSFYNDLKPRFADLRARSYIYYYRRMNPKAGTNFEKMVLERICDSASKIDLKHTSQDADIKVTKKFKDAIRFSKKTKPDIKNKHSKDYQLISKTLMDSTGEWVAFNGKQMIQYLCEHASHFAVFVDQYDYIKTANQIKSPIQTYLFNPKSKQLIKIDRHVLSRVVHTWRYSLYTNDKQVKQLIKRYQDEHQINQDTLRYISKCIRI